MFISRGIGVIASVFYLYFLAFDFRISVFRASDASAFFASFLQYVEIFRVIVASAFSFREKCTNEGEGKRKEDGK